MKKNFDDDRKQAVALWRYGIIALLIHGNLSNTTMQDALADLSKKEYLDLDNCLVKFTSETLRKWLYKYNTGGLAELEDKERSDKGEFQIPLLIQEKIKALREENPKWRTSMIFADLRKEKIWNGIKPSVAALYRFVDAFDLQRSKKGSEKAYRAFQFDKFGHLWISDFLHGPKLTFGKEKKKVYLHAIIDDCTRYIVAADFHTSEGVEVMMSDLKKAVLRHGLPTFYYTDNGSAYKSNCLKIVGARLKIALPHTPPYKPQGRAKIERFFSTVRMKFLDVKRFSTLDEIRKAFQEWLSEYHQGHHKGIKCSPLEQRMKVESACRFLPETTNVDVLFYMMRRCMVHKDGTAQLKKRRYELPKEFLPGTRVEVYYDDADLTKVYVGPEYKVVYPVNLLKNARRFETPAYNTKKEKNNEGN